MKILIILLGVILILIDVLILIVNKYMLSEIKKTSMKSMIIIMNYTLSYLYDNDIQTGNLELEDIESLSKTISKNFMYNIKRSNEPRIIIDFIESFEDELEDYIEIIISNVYT